MTVEESEGIVGSETLYLLRLTRKVKHVILLQHKVRRRQLLVDSADKSVLSCTATKLQHIYTVFPVYVQVHHCLAYRLRVVRLDMDTEEVG